MTISERIVTSIFHDLEDRQGIKQILNRLKWGNSQELEDYYAIKRTMVQIVEEHLKEHFTKDYSEIY